MRHVAGELKDWGLESCEESAEHRILQLYINYNST